MTQQTADNKQQTIVEVLMERDGLDLQGAQEVLEDCREMVRRGLDPEIVLLVSIGVGYEHLPELL